MSTKFAVGLAAGLLLGAGGGYLTAQSQSKVERDEAHAYQMEFAQKNSELTNKNIALERRAETLSNSTYDRQKIRECLRVSTTLSTAIGDYLNDRPMGAIARGTLLQHMSSTFVAVQDKSRQAALLMLAEDHARIDEECLDNARISMDHAAG